MFSFPAKFLLPLVILFFFLSCSRESSPPLWEPQTELGGRDYNGGLFPVWIVLKEPVENSSSIEWTTGTSRIAYRNQAINADSNIISDTAFIYWEKPPQPTIKIDSVRISSDSTYSWKLDTAYFYIDTIFATVNGQKSLPIIIEVKNILPRITKLTVGDFTQSDDSLFTIASHTGNRLEISIYLEKPFNNAFHPIVKMPTSKMEGLRVKTETDSLWVYEWTVPNKPVIDTSLYLQIEDSGGRGQRLYKLYLVVYTEEGSVWVASQKELVKYSPFGIEVARISDTFNDIDDISINSNNGRLYVIDRLGNSFAIYDTYGNSLYKNDSMFNSPSGVAVDIDGDYIWVADAIDASSVSEAQLRNFRFDGATLILSTLSYEMSGPIKGLSVDQSQKDFVWFAIPQSDTVGFVRNSNSDPTFIQNEWKRPSIVSKDPKSGLAWVAENSRIVAIDTSGKILANITGFDNVSSISASGGNVWAADIDAGKVYRFKGPFNGTSQDLSYTIYNGTSINFISPISVSAYSDDGGAWVVDRGAGEVVRLDSLGNIIASGTGLALPILGKTIQKAE